MHSAVFGRTDETSPGQRLSPLVPLGQEFHAEMVIIIVGLNGCTVLFQENYRCHRQEYDLSGQIQVKDWTNLTNINNCFRRKDLSPITRPSSHIPR